MDGKILITGITGTVGKEVAKKLIALGHPIKAAVREPSIEKVRKVFGDSIECIPFDFEKPETYVEAFKDVDRVFLMRPPAITDTKRYMKPAIDEAITSGVQHIVFLSLLGVEKNPIVPHYKVEKYILKTKIPYTFLRPSFFMQNLSEFHRDDLRIRNEIFVPAGSGRTSFIDCRDIAEVGTITLTDKSHRNKAYSLTGNEALDYYEVAEIFSKVLGRKITYTNPTSLQFRQKMKEMGIDSGFTTVMQGIYLTAKIGLAKKVTSDLQNLLGRNPITMRQFAEDFKHTWNKE